MITIESVSIEKRTSSLHSPFVTALRRVSEIESIQFKNVLFLRVRLTLPITWPDNLAATEAVQYIYIVLGAVAPLIWVGEGRGGYILVAWGQSTGAGSLEDDPTWPLPEFIIPQDGGWVGLGLVELS